MMPTPQQASYKHALYQYDLNSKVLITHKNKLFCGLMVLWFVAYYPSMRMCSEGYSTWSVCLSVWCVCVSITQHLTFHVFIHATNDTNLSGR